MKRTAALLALVVLLVGAAFAYRFGHDSDPAAAPPENLAPLVEKAGLGPCFGPLVATGLPQLSLPCLDGSGRIPLVGLTAATPTIVNVYASWCGPCAVEMPLLRQLYDQAGDKVRLIGVDHEDRPRQALLFAADLGQTWPALRDDEGVVNRSLGSDLPKTLFVTADGRIAYVARKGYTSLAQLKADLRRYLGVVL